MVFVEWRELVCFRARKRGLVTCGGKRGCQMLIDASQNLFCGRVFTVVSFQPQNVVLSWRDSEVFCCIDKMPEFKRSFGSRFLFQSPPTVVKRKLFDLLDSAVCLQGWNVSVNQAGHCGCFCC